MLRTVYQWSVAMLLFAACGDETEKPRSTTVVSGFRFAIAVEPSMFLPSKAEAVRVASDGKPATNPPDTVQLYTPNETLTWLGGPEGDRFGFDVRLTNFYRKPLCAVRVIVDKITPAKGHRFVEDDRQEGAKGILGEWNYGDVKAAGTEERRWVLEMKTRERFVLEGKVLADSANCGEKNDL